MGVFVFLKSLLCRSLHGPLCRNIQMVTFVYIHIVSLVGLFDCCNQWHPSRTWCVYNPGLRIWAWVWMYESSEIHASIFRMKKLNLGLNIYFFENYGKNLCFLNGGHKLSRYFSQRFQTTEIFSSMVCTNCMSRGLTNALYLVIWRMRRTQVRASQRVSCKGLFWCV